MTASLLLIFSGCNEEFLDKLPKDQLTEGTTFTTNANFETYIWSMYNAFPGYWDHTPINRERGSDLMINNSGTQGDALLWQLKTVPSASTATAFTASTPSEAISNLTPISLSITFINIWFASLSSTKSICPVKFKLIFFNTVFSSFTSTSLAGILK